MIISEEINGVVFVEQRTFYIYMSDEDRKNGKHSFVTSDEKEFIRQKESLQTRLSEKRNKQIENIVS